MKLSLYLAVASYKPKAIFLAEIKPYIPPELKSVPIYSGYTSAIIIDGGTIAPGHVLMFTKDPIKKAWLTSFLSSPRGDSEPVAKELPLTALVGGAVHAAPGKHLDDKLGSLPMWLLKIPQSQRLTPEVAKYLRPWLLRLGQDLATLKAQYPATREVAKRLTALFLDPTSPYANFRYLPQFLRLFQFLSGVGGWKFDTSLSNYRLQNGQLVLSDPVISMLIHNTIHRAKADRAVDRFIIQGR